MMGNDHILDQIDIPRNEESSQVHMYYARIRFSIPWINAYIVQPFGNSIRHPNLKQVSGPIGEGGGSAREVYGSGDCVVIADDTMYPFSKSSTGYIVGKISTSHLLESPYEEVHVSGKDVITAYVKVLHDRFRAWVGGLNLRLNRRNDSAIDALPKDVIINTPTGPSVACLKSIARVQASDKCSIELDNILKRERLEAYQKQWFSPVHNWMNGIEGNTFNRTEYTALDWVEGSYNTSASAAYNEYTTLDPIYRDQQIDGDLVSGWSSCKYLPSKDLVTAELVEREYTGYSGDKEVKSAKSIIWSKTPNILSPYPKKEYDGIDTYLEDVVEFNETYEQVTESSGITEDDRLRDKSLNMQTELDYYKKRFDRQQANDTLWTTSDYKRSAEMYDVVVDTQYKKLSNTSNNFYDLPKSIDLVDRHTGRTHKYYSSESFIRMDEDGSIVLTDGYGSEIRMFRGKIIISCPLDVELRPGRDLHNMSGRHTTIAAQKDVTLHSSRGDTYIKAQHNLELLGGLDREGKFVIDSRGLSGATIRSMGSLNIAGSDIFMGTISATNHQMSAEENTLTRYGRGRIIIDGGGTLALRANNSALLGRNVTLASISGNTMHTAITLSSSQVAVLSKYTYTTGNTAIGSLNNTVNIQIGDETFTYNNGTGRGTTHNLKVGGQILSSNGIICNTVRAKTIMGERGAFGNDRSTRGMGARFSSPFPTIVSPVFDVANPDRITIECTDAYQNSKRASGFSYKSSENIGITVTGYVMPGMLWQDMLETRRTWQEPEITSIVKDGESSMVYPGKGVWKDGLISQKGYTKKVLSEGYRIHG